MATPKINSTTLYKYEGYIRISIKFGIIPFKIRIQLFTFTEQTSFYRLHTMNDIHSVIF